MLVHKVSSSIFPYINLNLAFTFFFHGKARKINFSYWVTLFARVFSSLKTKISLKQFNSSEIMWRKKTICRNNTVIINKHNDNIIFVSFEKAFFQWIVIKKHRKWSIIISKMYNYVIYNLLYIICTLYIYYIYIWKLRS